MPIKSIVDDDPYIAIDPDGNEISRGSKKDKRYVDIIEHSDAHKTSGEYRIIQPEVKVGLIATTDVVAPPNKAPIWTHVPSPTWAAGIGGTHNLNNQVNDPEGDVLSYALNGGSAALPANVSLASNGVLTATSGVTEGVTSGIIVDVDDGEFTVASESFSITINTGLYLSAVPGAYSFGMDMPTLVPRTPVFVTNLNDSGAGSLTEAVNGPNRAVIFNTSGVIDLKNYGDLQITDDNIIVAGQTAPAPGIMVRGAGLNPRNCSNVLLQHMYLRVGDDTVGPDPGDRDSSIIKGNSDHIVYDHISFFWGTDETCSSWGFGTNQQTDVSYWKCLVAEGLHHPLVNDNASHTGKGLIVGTQLDSPMPERMAVVRCLFAHHAERCPYMMKEAFVANNVIYNALWEHIMLRGNYQAPGTAFADIVGNVFVDGLDTLFTNKPITLRNLSLGSGVYLDDNHAEWNSPGENQWDDLVYLADGTVEDNVKSLTPVNFPTGYVVESSATIKASVVADVGCRPGDRDATDQRIIDDVANGTGQLKTDVEGGVHPAYSRNQVPGGWPTLTENTTPLFTVPANPNDDAGTGYTNLEVALHDAAAALE